MVKLTRAASILRALPMAAMAACFGGLPTQEDSALREPAGSEAGDLDSPPESHSTATGEPKSATVDAGGDAVAATDPDPDQRGIGMRADAGQGDALRVDKDANVGDEDVSVVGQTERDVAQVPVDGGSIDASAERAPPSWILTNNMVEMRTHHTATLLRDSTVLIAGGDDVAIGLTFQGAKATSELYDPRTAMFFPNGSMNSKRTMHRAVGLLDGTVLVTGGLSPDCSLESAEIYHSTNRTFETVGSMAVRRYEHTVTLLKDGRVLVTGGTTSGANCSGDALSSAEIYDPSSRTFSLTGSMAAARFRHAAVLLADGRVLVTGGHAFGSNSGTSAELYDPLTGIFSPAGNMTYSRERHSATATPDGTIIIAGGIGDIAASGTSEQYDVGTNSFRLPLLVGASHSEHQDVVVLGSALLLIGGGSGATSFFDPALGRWMAGPAMNVDREGFAAVRLSDGSVLATGGNSGQMVEKSVEILR